MAAGIRSFDILAYVFVRAGDGWPRTPSAGGPIIAKLAILNRPKSGERRGPFFFLLVFWKRPRGKKNNQQDKNNTELQNRQACKEGPKLLVCDTCRACDSEAARSRNQPIVGPLVDVAFIALSPPVLFTPCSRLICLVPRCWILQILQKKKTICNLGPLALTGFFGH